MVRHHSVTRIVGFAVAALLPIVLLLVQAATALRPAPAFTLELLDGRTLSLAEYKGSPVILLFWAPW